jgi:hypothetical protein
VSLLAQLVVVALELVLHPECGVDRQSRVVFLGNGRAEKGEDAVARRLGDIAAVVLHRFDHQFQCRIYDGARFFRVQILHKVHGAFDVGEQKGDSLALALEILGGSTIDYVNR